MDRGAWQAAAHRVSMRQTQLSTQTHPEYTGLTHHDFSQESSPQNRETRTSGPFPQVLGSVFRFLFRGCVWKVFVFTSKRPLTKGLSCVVFRLPVCIEPEALPLSPS